MRKKPLDELLDEFALEHPGDEDLFGTIEDDLTTIVLSCFISMAEGGFFANLEESYGLYILEAYALLDQDRSRDDLTDVLRAYCLRAVQLHINSHNA